MKTFFTLLIGVVAGAAALWLVSARLKGEKKEEDAKAEHHEESAADEGVIKLDKKKQESAGIQTAQPKAAKLAEEVKGYGRVLDPAPIVGMMLGAQAAQATAEASEKDLRRLQALFAQGQNASARSLETAEAAAKRDHVLLATAQTKLQMTLGPALDGKVLDQLATLKWALARIDVPSGRSLAEVKTASIGALANENARVDAEILGPAPATDEAIQGMGFLALIKTNSFAPNTAISAALPLNGHEDEGFIVPENAVLQEGAETIAFVQTGDETFKKVMLETDRRTKEGWFVTKGISATDRVVIAGAHQLLSVTRAEPAE